MACPRVTTYTGARGRSVQRAEGRGRAEGSLRGVISGGVLSQAQEAIPQGVMLGRQSRGTQHL